MEFGLLGERLGHSYSPQIHKALGGYDYALLPTPPEALCDFFQKRVFRGINVTIPYKKTVMRYCDELSEAARAVGSVNTIVQRPDGSLYGHNTDVDGFREQLRRTGLSLHGKKVLLLGSGGASLAAEAVLREEKPRSLVVVSRQGEHNYENLAQHSDADLIVNATPVGMYPHTDEKPLTLTQFPSLEGVLDLIYNPARTGLLLEAEARGIVAVGGLSMLVYQAAAAVALFRGTAPSREDCEACLSFLSAQMENIVLIGMPGAGKSSLGQALAARLQRPFVDVDAILEERAGCTIPEFFAREGEAGFRCRETALLWELGRQSGLVLSTGGGCVTRAENFAPLHQNGKVIWIRRDLAALPTEGRPLSQGNLYEMYARRTPLYAGFADAVIDNSGTEDTAVSALEQAYQSCFAGMGAP